MKTNHTIQASFSPDLIGAWNEILSKEGHCHDLGQTPEWCFQWSETYSNVWKRLALVESSESIFPLMIRKEAGLRVLSWIGQRGGMMSDYSGGAGEFGGLLDALVDFDGWDVANLQFPHWQQETGGLLKALLRYEKFLWRVDVSDQSVVIDLPASFDEWLAVLARTPRTQSKRYARKVDEGIARFEILTGEEMIPAVDALIANNQTRWDVLRLKKDADFLRKSVCDLQHNTRLFLARLSDDSGCPAACLGYVSERSVFIHTAGIQREDFHGMAPGVAMYTLLVREMIRRNMRVIDFCPGLEEYKFRLGGHWVPGHRLMFARNRRAYCQYRCAESVVGFYHSCRNLAGRIYHERKGR